MLNVLFAMSAVAVPAYEWYSFDFNWKADIEASIVWMMLSLHIFEIGVDILLTMFLIAVSLSPRFNDTHRKGIDFDSITWYFLVGIWVPMYATIFLRTLHHPSVMTVESRNSFVLIVCILTGRLCS